MYKRMFKSISRTNNLYKVTYKFYNIYTNSYSELMYILIVLDNSVLTYISNFKVTSEVKLTQNSHEANRYCKLQIYIILIYSFITYNILVYSKFKLLLL